MTLPTTLGELITSSPADHAAWHNEIDGLVTSLGLPTVSTATNSGHLKAHEALHALIGRDAAHDMPAATIAADSPGALVSHLRVHQWLAGKTISNLTTTDDIQAALTAGSAGDVFVLAPGAYYPGTNLPSTGGLVPKAGQVLVGAYGASLNGSLALTSWTASGSDFYATRASGAAGSALPDSPGGEDRCAIAGCENRNDVFYDGAPLVRVASQGALGPGKFYEDFGANRVYIRDTPSGHVVRQAVANYAWKPVTAGSTIRNLVVEMFANQSQHGAVELNGDDCLGEYLEVRYNHGLGVRTNANRTRLRLSDVHHQMQMGLGSEGFYTDSTKGWDCLIEDVRVHHNNRDSSYLKGWEAGGTKWAYNRRLRVRRVWSHDNDGPGIWCDINNGNVIIEDCYAKDNVEWGIFYEISYGEVEPGDGLFTHIRNNVCDNNADIEDGQGFYEGGQITVSASRGVKVYGNIVRGKDGIGAIAQLRTDSSDPRGSHQVHGLEVYNNQIEITWVYPTSGDESWANAGGIKTDDTANQEPEVWTSQGNSFYDNDYFVPNHPGDANYPHWTWRGDLGTDFASWAQWQAYGQDTTGSGGSRTVGGTIGSFPSPPTTVYGPRGSLA